MEKYSIYHDATKTIVEADELRTNDVGQTTLYEIEPDTGKYHTVAIVPKEYLIIKTGLSTDTQYLVLS